MKKIVTGIGYDSHKLVKGRRFVLGGVNIQSDICPKGHSDADVLCHAIIDAVLGACSMSDIGTMFPDTDPKWKDANSIELLRKVGEIVSKEASIIYIDAVVVLESIKLMPFIKEMNSNIAQALNMPVSSINVKAKTNEGMGFIGRNEGISVIATASVERSL